MFNSALLKVSQHQYGNHVTNRLLDFFGSHTSWQRRLWNVGLVLGLKEVIEASEALQSGVLSQRAFEDLCQSVEISAGKDPAVGSLDQRRLLQSTLRRSPRVGSVDFHTLKLILDDVEKNYLPRWSSSIGKEGGLLSPERTARSIAAHLLDSGLSSTYLHRWLSFKIQHDIINYTLADLISDAHTLVHTPARTFEVLVLFIAAPRSRENMPLEWLDAPTVSRWLKNNSYNPRGLRQCGGLLLKILAKDAWTGVDQALEIVESLQARVIIGTRAELRVHNQCWIKDLPRPYPLQRTRRGVIVRALDREKKLYTQSRTTSIDAALELISSLDSGPPAQAVSGGWASLETLLLGPGDGGDRGVAADRLASLIACSFSRAELTTLSYAHQSTSDPLAKNLKGATANRARAALIAEALNQGIQLTLRLPSDRIAEMKLKAILKRPRQVLLDIEKHVRQAIRRLYRQRNLVLHWGRINAVCLNAALRTAAPLIGAGHDRIVHAWFVENTTPLELASRAKLRLDLLETSNGCSPTDLLEK